MSSRPRPGPRPADRAVEPTRPGAPPGRIAAALGHWRGWPVGEVGGATLVGLALASFVLMAGLVSIDVGALAGARAAAQTAADLAALAALTPQDRSVAVPAHSRGEAQAAGIAAANGAELTACDCSAIEAVVKVRRRLRLVPGGLTVSVSAGARAVLAQPPASRATVRALAIAPGRSVAGPQVAGVLLVNWPGRRT